MEKIKFIIYLLISLISISAFSQEYELGKVTIEELKETKHSKDTSAVAAFLFNKGKVSFEYNPDIGFVVKTDVWVKIKIYKKEGYHFANKAVQIYVGDNGNKEKVDFSKAVTYNVENGVIVKSKLKSDGEFTEKINKFYNEQKIVMPNIKEGCIVEYMFTHRSPFFSNLPEWNFEKTIPVNYSEFVTDIPEYFTYSTYFKGALSPKITKLTESKTFNFIDKGKYGGPASNQSINYLENHTKYVMSNVNAIKQENFVNNVENYVSSIIHELLSIRYPNSAPENYAFTWEDVTKKIYLNDSFGNQLKKENYFEADIDKIISGVVKTDEKIQLIFDYVKSKLTWNGLSGYYTDEGVKKAYEVKTGNVAEINLMLISMLNYANLKANPILVSTRSNGIPLFPSRTGFNYVIAGVELDNKTIILLDATNKNASPNIIPERAMNWFGRMIRKDGTSEMVDLYPKKNSIENVSILAELQADGTIKGKQRKQLTDYYAFLFRNENGNRNEENYIEELEKRENFSLVEEYKLDNLNDLTKPIIETYSFTSNSLVDIIGSKIYFSPMLFHQIAENPFKAENRLYPVDFNFPIKDSYTFSIKIPEGYVLESKPESLNIAMEDNKGSFKYTVSENMGTIQFACSLEINAPIIESAYYQHLKEFFNQIVLKQNEKIVLIKK